MNKLYISIFQSIYLAYMFCFFKTSINFDVLKINFENNYLKHSTIHDYGLKICPFGQQIIWLLIFILIIRNVYNISQTYIYYSLYIALGLSLLMNWNAFVYILPVFIIELHF